MTAPTCATCRHFRELAPGKAVIAETSSVEPQGECRRFPPRMVAPNERAKPGWPLLPAAEFPIVDADMDCGEHFPAETVSRGGLPV